MNLDVSKWESFFLKDLYIIKMGDKLDKNKMSQDCPTINFVSRISYNNGVDIKVDKIEGKDPNKAGLLTVSLGGEYLGSCYIQKEPFYTAQNVAIMEARFPQMTVPVNHFICALVKFECQTKYYAFGRELNTHINNDFEINLPIKYRDNGIPLIDKDLNLSKEGFVPDWEFMEQYITSLNSKKLTTQNTNNALPLDITTWKEFRLSQILTLKKWQRHNF